ncbi:MAG: FHA domain-containing protein [Burkholderiales bacterium]|jgi:hypothetical protein|nr:FHA domain-containing protein [Burkholderiales bacterium]
MIWVEILSRNREVLSRSHHAADGDLLIGRSYSNDVMIDDACVAPQHVLLHCDEHGIWTAEDCGSQNGLLDSRGRRCERMVLTGDTVFQIGQTWLRIRGAGFPVAPERRMVPQQRRWPWIIVLAVILLGLYTLQLWSNLIGESRPALDLLLPNVSLIIMLVVWISLWAGLSRLLSGAANFTRHTVIALCGSVCALLFTFFVSWATFAFSFRLLVDYGFVASWLILGATCFYHLRAISARRLRLKAIIVAVLFIAAAAVQWLASDSFNFQRGTGGNNAYLKNLWPPAARVIAPQSQEAFFREVEKIKANLDESRKKEPEEGGLFEQFLDGDD